MSEGLTQEDRKKLAELANRQGRKGSGMYSVECDRIRQQFKQGKSVPELVESVPVERKQTHSHLRGQCRCANEEEPITVIEDNKSVSIHCPHCEDTYSVYERLRDHINTVHNA